MAPPTTAPLPLAPDRAALSNRIAMALGAHSSVLKSMNLSGGRRTATATATANPHDDDDAKAAGDADMWRAAPANEGVGYVAESSGGAQKDSKRQDKVLRGRLLGKRRTEGRNIRGRWEESESEEDVGRSALGKRKRAKKVQQDEPAATAGGLEVQQDNGEEKDEAAQEKEPGAAVPDVVILQEGSAAQGKKDESTTEQTKKKKKKKNKKKKQENET
ncbi:hypothetical protein S40285_02995 [Stachybotrys chlorohalonatus IBT 40285]|uniref:Uncharacterized protein n=1 Tax=Stachybotrys chlorohalonatus (strain IBT 40285) TaxID=1283841 RepID=A0A084QSZ2_STAC4|nr:hypothetical protein S40285_02995 [Stachybotrys chlorohalonata IBT 40285]